LNVGVFSVGAEEGDSDVVVSGTVLGSTEVVVVAGTPVVVVVETVVVGSAVVVVVVMWSKLQTNGYLLSHEASFQRATPGVSRLPTRTQSSFQR
jgi:hypothetical protein